jgi:hypothetical protein
MRESELKQPQVTRSDLMHFLGFCKRYLKLAHLPVVDMITDPAWSVDRKSFGEYHPERRMFEISVVNRHPMDVYRTAAHELIHHWQNVHGIKDHPRDLIEIQANKLAAMLVKVYAYQHPEVFGATDESE